MSADEAVRRTDLRALMTELAGEPIGQNGRERWHCIVSSHEDRNPSTTVFVDNTGKERWKCWSCDHGGTAIDALVEARSMSVADAISELEDRTGSADTTSPSTAKQPAKRPISAPIPLSSDAENYLTACHRLLWTRSGSTARSWLHDRGLPDNVLRDNLVGFDPGPRLLDRAEGLPGNMTDKPYMTRGGGVVYVSFGRDGSPVHVQCRLLHPRTFKYVNPRREHGSIPSASFPRTSIVGGPVIVTEGISDALIAVTAGFRSAAITAATTVRADTAQQISAYANGERVLLALDNDDAGRPATTALKGLLGRQAAVMRLPADHDLTDTYRKDPTTCLHPSPAQMTSSR